MIDLSHLTEEEQGAIMTVLRRDAELKKAEDDRIGKLEKTHSAGSKPDSQWKYLSGEWFYEAKSRRHTDKIHGSEIILASMKAQNAPLDGSPLIQRSPTLSSAGLDVAAPPKPARSLENLQPATINDSKEKKSPICSPRVPRQNPFNQASVIIYEAPDNISFKSSCRQPESSEREDAALLESHPEEDSSQTSETSSTSEASSPELRPVPRKRTFVSRPPSSSDRDARPGPASVVPTPRQRWQAVQEDAASRPQENPQRALNDGDQPAFSENKYGGTPYLKRDSSDTETSSDTDEALGEEGEEPRDEPLGERAVLRSDVLQRSSIQDSDGGGEGVRTAARPDELSLPQSTADPDPPVSYDLNFIDKSDEQMKKSNQKNVFTLTTQSTSPTGDEESIAKVLDWFSRSTDRSDWINSAGGPEVRKGSDQNAVVSKSRSEDPFKNDGGGTSGLLQRKLNQAKALRAAHRSASTELLDTEDNVYLPRMKSVWDRHKIGPKVLIIKSMIPKNRRQTPGDLSADSSGGNNADMTSEPGRYSWKGTYGGESEQRAVTSPQTEAEYPPHSSSSQEAHGPNIPVWNYRRYSDLAASPQAADRRGSDAGSANVSRMIQPRLNEATESPSKSNPRPDMQLGDEPSRAPKSDADLQTRYSPRSYSRSRSYVDNLQGGDDAMADLKKQRGRNPYKDASWNSEDKRVRPSASPVRNADVTDADRNYSPRRNVQYLPHQESSADKIKQLKSFWEQERKPCFYRGDFTRGPSQSKVNKRFTKSEYDLSALGNGDSSDVAAAGTESANLGTSQMQFNSLRNFWDEATSGKPKSTVGKEPLRTQLLAKDFICKEPEILPKTRPVAAKLSPALQKMSTIDCSRDLSRQDTGKEFRPRGSRKESFETSSSRSKSMRRAASMFTLSAPEENDQVQMDPGPSHLQSGNLRQNSQKSVAARRPAEETETPTPRARAYVPTDYRHYLGMTDEASFQASLAPNPEDEEEKDGYGYNLGGPVRVSAPVSSEERHGRRSGKMSQRLWANYSSDTGPDSSLSSTSDSWSHSHKNSNRGNDHGAASLITKALMRAETRSKSLEDLTASPVQERKQAMTADNRGTSDVSSVPSPNSSVFSDPDPQKLRKSVPLFLQKEDDTFTDSNSEHSFNSGQITKGGSLTNLTSSSGLSSLSGSRTTMYGGDLEVQGNIMFSLNYIQKLKEFHIFVSQCQDLAAADPKKGRSDPYVKSYLVPDKSNLGKRKTSVKKKTLSPTFNEILRYRVTMEYLRTQTLILSVWHNDTFGRNSFLGEVELDMSKWDFDHTRMNYFPLKSRNVPNLAATSGRGQINLAVRYLPQISHGEGFSHFFNGEIHIWVKECRDLPLIRATINPYVKCFMLPDTSKKSRQKTRVVRRAVDPVFNHTMVYDGIRDIDLMEACVEITVWDRDKLATNLLGGLRLGIGTGTSYGTLVEWMDSTPAEVALWERMKSKPNEWVEDVLPLRMLNPAKASFK